MHRIFVNTRLDSALVYHLDLFVSMLSLRHSRELWPQRFFQRIKKKAVLGELVPTMDYTKNLCVHKPVCFGDGFATCWDLRSERIFTNYGITDVRQ